MTAQEPADNCWTSLPDGLLDLLAVIHRDGGHYTTAHGLEKSIRDAEKEILAMTEAQNNTEKPVMNLHKQILNMKREGLPHNLNRDNISMAYRMGYRDARHDAAKMVAGSGVTIGGWMPIETAPKDGSWVIVYGEGTCDGEEPRKIAVAHCVTGGLNEWWQFTLEDVTSEGDFANPTHWMPLPEAPNEGMK